MVKELHSGQPVDHWALDVTCRTQIINKPKNKRLSLGVTGQPADAGLHFITRWQSILMQD